MSVKEVINIYSSRAKRIAVKSGIGVVSSGNDLTNVHRTHSSLTFLTELQLCCVLYAEKDTSSLYSLTYGAIALSNV